MAAGDFVRGAALQRFESFADDAFWREVDGRDSGDDGPRVGDAELPAGRKAVARHPERK